MKGFVLIVGTSHLIGFNKIIFWQKKNIIFSFFKKIIDVCSIYNVVLISIIQQSYTVVHIMYSFSYSFPLCFITGYWMKGGLPRCQWVKNLAAVKEPQETWVQSLVGNIPWRRKCQPTPGFLPRKSHGYRSLVGYSPWSHKELVCDSWFTVFISFCSTEKWLIHLYIHSFLYSFPLCLITGYWM